MDADEELRHSRNELGALVNVELGKDPFDMSLKNGKRICLRNAQCGGGFHVFRLTGVRRAVNAEKLLLALGSSVTRFETEFSNVLWSQNEFAMRS